MKRILVPTDFSAGAQNALGYARLLAVHYDAQLTLVHLFSPPPDPMRIGIAAGEMLAEAKAKLAATARQLRGHGLRVTETVRQGAVVAGIKAIAFRDEVDLLVMGCQGEDFQPGRFAGSTTTALMDEINLPILAVPHNFAPGLPANMAWATDLTAPASTKVLAPLLDLLPLTNQELTVFHLLEDVEKALTPPDMGELLPGADYTTYAQTADGRKVEDAILHFIAKTNTDLIAMVHRHKGWFSKLMQASATRNTVWVSPIPVLILQDH